MSCPAALVLLFWNSISHFHSPSLQSVSAGAPRASQEEPGVSGRHRHPELPNAPAAHSPPVFAVESSKTLPHFPPFPCWGLLPTAATHSCCPVPGPCAHEPWRHLLGSVFNRRRVCYCLHVQKTRLYVYVYIHMCVYIYTYVYIYICEHRAYQETPQWTGRTVRMRST